MSVLAEAEILAAVSEAELLSGVPPLIVASRAEIGPRAVVVARRRLGRSVKSRAPAGRWSPEERAFVKEHLGHLSSAEISARLGRSINAIKILRVRRGWAAPSKLPDEVTICRAAEVLGVDSKTVMRWTQSCGLRSRQLPLDRAIFTIRRKDLEAWVVNPVNWVYLPPASIRDPRLRRLCELRSARWGDRWLTPGQAARVAGCRHQDVNRWIHAGKVPGARQWGNWWILESVARGLRIPKGRGSGHEIAFSVAFDVWLLIALGAGLPMSEIASMSRMPPYRVSYRASCLLKRPALRRRLDGLPGMDLLSFRGRECFVDWRRLAHRFPSMGRAVRRLSEVGPHRLTAAECRVLRGVLHAWASWHRLPCASGLRCRVRSLPTARRVVVQAWEALRGIGLDPFGLSVPLPLATAYQGDPP